MKTFKHLIGGKWVDSDSGKTFDSLNPTTGKPIASFQLGTKKDVDKAVRAAKNGFGEWRDMPAPKRGEILFEVAAKLRKSKERLSKLMATEMGKVMPETRGDVQEAIDIFEYMAGEGRRLFGHTTPSELRDKFCMTVRQPVGVVGLITPWNFPIAIPAWKLAPALICGNGIVFKPASDTPWCALELVKIIDEAGVPDGVLNFVTGPGGEVGGAITGHPDIRGISFTGSRAVGQIIAENAGLKRVGLELGGKNPIIIMDDAKLDLALEGVLWGAFGTAGQRCTAASRIIVHEKIKERFEDMLLKRVRKLKLGDPTKASTDIGPLINQKAVEKTHKYTEIGKKEGARLCCGGEAPRGPGFFYKPTVFTDVKWDMQIAQDEIFGPSTALIPVKSFGEALKAANSVSYGLSSSIYTENMQYAFRAIDYLEAGITYINSSTIGAEVHLPFGGVKDTGNGTREAGIEGIHEFSEAKAVYFDYSGKLQKAQIDVVK